MNAYEQTQKTEEHILNAINESNLPLTTIYYMLSNIQRQIVEVMNQLAEGQQENTPKEKSEDK